MSQAADDLAHVSMPMPEALALLAHARVNSRIERMQFPVGGEAWVVYRLEDARLVLEDRRFRRSDLVRRELPYASSFPAFLKTSLLFKDPPEHTSLRRLVAKAFTARRVEGLRPRTQEIADALLDNIEQRGYQRFDLVGEFSLPLPIMVITELLGVPYEHRDDFIRWSHSALATSGMTADEIESAQIQLRDYLAGMIAAKRRHPADDLISALAQARDRDETLSDDQILPVAMLLIVGGFDNTANAIDNGVLALLNHPDQKQRFLTDISGTIKTLTEEVLRHGRSAIATESATIASSGVPYVATEDVEIAGVTVKKGEAIKVHALSANHDEAAFDNPNDFNVTRQSNPHLAFSHGIHHCLGAPLARMELQVAFTSIFRRFPDLRLADAPEYRTGALSAGMSKLMVER